jgi:hypothetical protein
MSIGKGLAFATVGAVAGALVWGAIIQTTGWSLWILAPIVGGAAGFGMMKGTQMRGSPAAGVGAAVVTILAIIGTRYYVVNQAVAEEMKVDHEVVLESLTYEVATELEESGAEVVGDDGDFLPAVYQRAQATWDAMSPGEQQAYAANLQDESEAATAVLTPLTLIFDFGIIGTFCAALSAGAAFKAGSKTLEEALVEAGQAESVQSAGPMAASLRSAPAKPGTPAEGGAFWRTVPGAEEPAPDVQPMSARAPRHANNIPPHINQDQGEGQREAA